MKKFRTFIITRQGIKRAVMITGVLAAAAGVFTVIRLAHPAVPTFSGQEDIPRAILDAGTPHEDESKSIKNLIRSVLGFDTDKPETIIESSSAIFREDEAELDEVPDNTAAPSETQQPQMTASDVLPSHEQIVSARGLKLNNATNYNINLDSLCSSPMPIRLDDSGPEVLIMHTHTTECFSGDEMAGESERTTDETHNMCAVGDVIENTLAEYGIRSYHDKTIHDYPSYQGSYTRALKTITENLRLYPSIKVVLDVHRDAYIYNDGTKLRVAANINGRDTAQVMLVLGTDSMGLEHPNWKENLTLAAKVQNAADIMYPGLMRPVNLRRERFNMHASKGSLLMEIGSNGNTLDEALSSGEYIARALAAVLLNG